MQRAILTPPVLAADALAEIKDWLAITTDADDAPLTALLLAALEMCEAFTGQMPLLCTCEEYFRPTGEWRKLATIPVQAIEAIEAIAPDNTRSVLPVADYAIELDADGSGRVRILRLPGENRIAVRFTAGMAVAWADLPIGLCHGIIRLAAHHYRQRDLDAKDIVPPAAVAALWRPWRRMRLA